MTAFFVWSICEQIQKNYKYSEGNLKVHFFDFFEFSFYIICLYTGHFIIVKFCQKAEKINFIKFWPLIKSPGPFCHSSAEPKSQIFGNFSSNLRRTNLKSLWGRHGTLIVILMYVCINPKMSPIRDPVRGRKNAPIDCCRYTYIIFEYFIKYF